MGAPSLNEFQSTAIRLAPRAKATPTFRWARAKKSWDWRACPNPSFIHKFNETKEQAGRARGGGDAPMGGRPRARAGLTAGRGVAAPRGPRAGEGRGPAAAGRWGLVPAGADGVGPTSRPECGQRRRYRRLSRPRRLSGAAAGAGSGSAAAFRRCAPRGRQDEGVPGPAGALDFPAGERRPRRAGGVRAGARSGQGPRADLLLPQQPPGRATPGGGAPMGARRRHGEPGPPPAQDSEGTGGRGLAGGMGMATASGQGPDPPPAPPPPPPRSARHRRRWSIPLSLPSAPLRKPLTSHADLFQDLSQFQETWLTEGRLLPLALFCFVRLSVVSLLMFVTAPLLCMPSSKHEVFFSDSPTSGLCK